MSEQTKDNRTVNIQGALELLGVARHTLYAMMGDKRVDYVTIGPRNRRLIVNAKFLDAVKNGRHFIVRLETLVERFERVADRLEGIKR